MHIIRFQNAYKVALLTYLCLLGTGCGFHSTDNVDAQQRSQTLTVFTAQSHGESAHAAPTINFGYNQARGWHFATSTDSYPIVFPGTDAIDLRQSPLLDFTVPQISDSSNGGTFSGRSKRASNFSGSAASLEGFSSPGRTALRFSATSPRASNFNPVTSSGTSARCSLRGHCHLTFLLCEGFQNRQNNSECNDLNLASCYEEADRTAARIDASITLEMCAYANYYDCLYNAYIAGTDLDEIESKCVERARDLEQFTHHDDNDIAF